MKTFSERVRRNVINSQAWLCGNEGCTNSAEQAHHILPNTKTNQKKYPLYLHSPMNCLFLCGGCHLNKPLPKRPNYLHIQACEEYLTYLKEDGDE